VLAFSIHCHGHDHAARGAHGAPATIICGRGTAVGPCACSDFCRPLFAVSHAVSHLDLAMDPLDPVLCVLSVVCVVCRSVPRGARNDQRRIHTPIIKAGSALTISTTCSPGSGSLDPLLLSSHGHGGSATPQPMPQPRRGCGNGKRRYI
jgi:hypothetical protein